MWTGTWALVWGGCDELTDCEQAARVDEPELVVGWGEDTFERALEEGESVQVVSGSQGGQHVWLAVSTRGLAPGNRGPLLFSDKEVPTFLAEAIGADDGVVYASQGWNYFAMDGEPDQATLALGSFVVSDLDRAAYDQELVLRVTGSDVCGNEVVGEVAITLEGVYLPSY
ncbi:MAG: hypothetical protein ABMA64_29710 [Myxococcota bacterium]